MGVEDRWQERAPRHMPAWRGRDDRNGRVQRRLRRILIAGSALLLAAMMLTRSLPNGPSLGGCGSHRHWRETDARTAKAGRYACPVIAKGHFARIDPLNLDQGRTAMRPVAAN